MQYHIYEDYMEDVEKKINHIAKKCKKHGNDFKYEKLGTETKEIADEFGRKRCYTFYTIEVEGTAKIDDWEFIATLEIHEAGNIIRKYNTDIEVPVRFRTTGNICEHCNCKRNRKELYIIHNIKNDYWKQVGRNCLMLYTNGLNAEYVASYMDGITELEEHNYYLGLGIKPMYPVEEILGYATEIIDKIGYFNSESKLPTKHLVSAMLSPNTFEYNLKFINNLLPYNVQFEKSDFFKSSTEEKVNNIIEHYKNITDNSEFIHNIKVMLATGYVYPKSIGYLSYLPQGYNKFVEHEKLKKKEQSEEINEHFGNIGQRFKDVKIKSIKTLSTYETMYGLSYFCKVILNDGHVCYWSGNGFNSEIFSEKEDKYIPCKPDTISFTIKEHGEYKGTPQTKITRCKIKYKIV